MNAPARSMRPSQMSRRPWRTERQTADYDKMAKLNGAAFDKAFEHMVKDHKKDIAAYQKASRKQDAAGQYAQSTLPT
jgi:hypothetical protein